MRKLLALILIVMFFASYFYVFHGKNYKTIVINPRMLRIIGKYYIDSTSAILNEKYNPSDIVLEFLDKKRCKIEIGKTEYDCKWSVKNNGELRLKTNKRLYKTDIYFVNNESIKLVFNQFPDISGFIVFSKKYDVIQSVNVVDDTNPKNMETN